MESEWNLSDKIRIFKEGEEIWTDGTNSIILETDVREFIKRLKEIVHEMEAPLKAIYGKAQMEISWKIDKLAGEKLC